MVMIPNAPRLSDMSEGAKTVPAGVYFLRLSKAELKKTGPTAKNPGAPMASVQLTIFGPEEMEQYLGQKVFDNFNLVGEGTFKVRQFLESAGMEPDFVLEDTDQLLELEVKAVVSVDPERTENGKVYPESNRIVRYMPVSQ